MSTTAILIVISLALTITAFSIKGIGSAMLHFAALVVWLVSGYAMYNSFTIANNTYIPIAGFLVATVMTLIHIAGGINVMLGLRPAKPGRLSYDEEKEQLKQNIYDKTRKPRGY